MAADKAGKAVIAIVAAAAIRKTIMPILLKGIAPKENWQSKLGGLALLDVLVQRAPAAVSASLPEIVPAMAEIMSDAKPQVKVSSHSLLTFCITEQHQSSSAGVVD